MKIIFLSLACVFFVLIFLALSILEMRSESGTAFRLLRKMTAFSKSRAEVDTQGRCLVFARRLRAVLPRVDERLLRPRLQDAGMYTERQADAFLLLVVAFFISAVLLASLLPGPKPLWFLLLVPAGTFGPLFHLRTRGRRRQASIAKGLPDVIDLMIVCVEAGVGLDQAIWRVGGELAETHPAIHAEFSRLLQYQSAGMTRPEAWQQMAERLRIPEMDSFAGMILQTERFGTPISRGLSEFAALSRQKRTQAVEQAAAKTTIKMSFPLVLFIFPCVFIVLLGPALLNMSRALADLFR